MTAQDKAGLHGYSSPNKPHVIFCPDDGQYDWCKGVMDALGVDYIEGQGAYKGVEEPCWAVDYDEFWKVLYVKIHPGIKNQETFLILGTLQSMNWRDASLYYQDAEFHEPRGGYTKKIGTWHEVANVKGREGWSLFNGHYYAVEHNPPDCMEEVKERETAQLVMDLRNELAAVLGARMNREQGQLLRSATVWLNGKTIVDGTRIVA